MPQNTKAGQISDKSQYSHYKADANPPATEAFKVGETGDSPKNTSKRALVTLNDSIVASDFVGSPFDETDT